MTVARSGWVVLGVFLLGFWLLMQAQSGDLILDALIWAAILLALGHQALDAFRGKPHNTDLTAGLPGSWRRWLMGESKKS